MSKYYKEGAVLLTIFYAIIWLIDEYMGMLLCSTIAIISGGIMIFAATAELIQRSKVPTAYFWWMLISTLIPVFVSMFFSFIYQGNFDWLQN